MIYYLLFYFKEWKKIKQVERNLPYQCVECKKPFSSESAMAQHAKNTHNNSERFEELKEEKREQKKQEKLEQGRHVCEECESSFKSLKAKLQHEKDSHPEKINIVLSEMDAEKEENGEEEQELNDVLLPGKFLEVSWQFILSILDCFNYVICFIMFYYVYIYFTGIGNI